jgi:Lon protease-like protein
MQSGLLPLFPLEVVLMPGNHLPLHIFEDRYKQMIGEALRDKTEFGIILVGNSPNGQRGLVETGCTASIEAVLKEHPDGRLDIVTLGRRRFELLLVNEERDFLRGAVEFFDDDDPTPASDADRKLAIESYNTLQFVWKNPPLEEPAYADPCVSFRLVRCVRDLGFRQSILESRSEAVRLRMLAETLPPLAQQAFRDQASEQADPRNGHTNGHQNGHKSSN